MALETGTYISDLVATNPAVGDDVSVGDDHIRLLKSTILATFPNVTGAVTATHTELNYVDGVTSAIQTQLNAKAAIDSPALTGTPTAPTATAGTNTTQIATTAFVQTAVGGVGATGAWTLLKSTTASSDATVDFVNGSGGVVLGSTYDEYILELINVKPSAEAVLYFRTSSNAGSSYDSGASDYDYAAAGARASTSTVQVLNNEDAGFIAMTGNVNQTTGSGYSGTIMFSNPDGAQYFNVRFFGTYFIGSSTDMGCFYGCGVRKTTADVDAVRVLFSTGNIASGTINLYARRK